MKRFKIDRQAILNAAAQAMADTVVAADDAFKGAIAQERYDWPNLTQRRNGQVAGSPRNIVDLGNLLNSQAYQQVAPLEYSFSWSAPYAAINHEGGQFKNGRRFTARPWTTQGIRGDSTAPTRYQNADAILNAPEFFSDRFKTYTQQRRQP